MCGGSSAVDSIPRGVVRSLQTAPPAAAGLMLLVAAATYPLPFVAAVHAQAATRVSVSWFRSLWLLFLSEGGGAVRMRRRAVHARARFDATAPALPLPHNRNLAIARSRARTIR